MKGMQLDVTVGRGRRGRLSIDWARAAFAPSLVFVAASLVAWFRLTPVTRGTIWAEDGEVFLQDAVAHGGPAAIFRPYAGYLQFEPRVVGAFVAGVLPVAHYAVAMAAAGCLTAGICAAVVFICSSAVTNSILTRGALAAVTVLAPLLPIEVLGNMANVHTFFLWAAPWLLLYTPRTRPGAVALGVFALVGVLTEIQMLLVLPLALLNWRDRLKWPVTAGLVFGGVAQLVATLVSPRPTPSRPAPTPGNMVRSFLANVLERVWSAGGGHVHTTANTELLISASTVLLVVGACVLTWQFGSRPAKLLAVALPLLSVVGFTAATVVNRSVSYIPRGHQPGHFSLIRYGAFPSMCLIASIVLGAATIWSLNTWTRIVSAAVLLLLISSAIANFEPAATKRAAGPVWANVVHAARASCIGSQDAATRILHTAPTKWGIEMSCGELLH